MGREAMGNERRQPPVLAPGAVVIGGRAHRRAGGEDVLPRPRVRPAGVDADRQVLHETQRRRRAGKLFVDEPLEPLVEADAIRALGGEACHVSGFRSPILGRPPLPARAVSLGEGAERPELSERRALLTPVAREAPIVGERGPELFERLAFQLPDRIPVDAALRVQRAPGRGEPLEVGARGIGARHVLDAEIERVTEPPAAWIIGTGLERGDGGRG